MTRLSKVEIGYISFMCFCAGFVAGAEVARRLL